MSDAYDVFVSYNSTDDQVVVDIATRLKQRGLKVWLDLWECAPGAPFQDSLAQGLRSARAVAVMVGKDEMRPWVVQEVRASIDEGAKRDLAVIPVLIPGAPDEPDLPLFLRQYTWIDLRRGVTEQAMDDLQWGISGVPPARMTAQVLPGLIQTSAKLLDESIEAKGRQGALDDPDAMAMPVIKRRLHVSSEIVAQDAAAAAAMAARTYPHDALTVLVPLVVELRWNRGYASALKRLLRIPEATKRLGDYECQEASPPAQADSGLVSAEPRGPDRIVVMLDGTPAAEVVNLGPDQVGTLLESVNLHGRLGASHEGGLSTLERIRAIQVQAEEQEESTELVKALYKNRDVLVPLVARFGMPGDQWLLPAEEGVPEIARESLPPQVPGPEKPEHRQGLPRVESDPSPGGQIEDFAASGAWRPRPQAPPEDPEIQKLLAELLRRAGPGGPPGPGPPPG